MLGVLVISGSQVGQIEPGLARRPLDLSSQSSLWLVTVLDSNPEPSSSDDLSVAGPATRTLVFTPNCTFYEDAGTGFEAHAIYCALSPLPTSSP